MKTGFMSAIRHCIGLDGIRPSVQAFDEATKRVREKSEKIISERNNFAKTANRMRNGVSKKVRRSK